MIHCLSQAVLLLSTAIAAALSTHETAPGGVHQTPNIIFFLSDDHRADVLGCAGHEVVQTPNIDQLAGRGVRFENAFVTTSICAASRATILTGLVERTHGYTFGTPPLARAWCQQSYPSLLRAAGYRTGFVGKFGVNVAGGQVTLDDMFDSFTALGRRSLDESARHFTDVAGDKAIEFITAAPPDQPFCLSVSFHAAHAEDGDKINHYPYPPTEAELYTDGMMPRPRLDDPAIYEAQPQFLKDSLNRQRYFWRWDTPEKYDRNLRDYFRMLSGLDRNIGRVMQVLDDRGLADDTIIIFMSDNGYYMGERGFAGKWSHYEESLRVPLIICDPRVPESMRGRVLSNLALNLDIAPTILDVAGVEPPGYQGQSLLRHTSGGVKDERSGFYCEHRMEHAAIPRWEGYRTGRYKYARYPEVEGGGEFLHDLEADPDELVNLAGDARHADTLAELRRLCARSSDSYVDQALPGGR